MYKLKELLGGIRKDKFWKEHASVKIDRLKRVIREHFFEEGMLKDGHHDATIRPNVFLAYYVYPDLLTSTEWEKVFDVALEKLWLPWGGLATIDRDHELFQPNNTGENSASYHRGDSWYWLNNLTALCLLRLNKEKYGAFIMMVVGASTEDILWGGAIGHASEVSSAARQESKGCWQQAWSNATFIELVKELER